ncbi:MULTISPECIES: CPBP family intramembrane glutamic endopeptidase [unclassified Pedobacter]|nr:MULTISPECIES: CPBP family intramembrane glutamic endopeptidase [unclassified Pedobacter]NII85543.1 hypothetical protein [Pedobacter sp. SG908]NMN39541.1 hypothetical protein [Pedobacter sp. SG918]
MKNPAAFIITFSFFLFIVSFLFDYFTELIEFKYGTKIIYTSRITNKEFSYKLVLSCFLAPIIETYFFQKAPYDILKKKNAKKWMIILISSSLFGLVHFSSFAYMLYGFFAGIVLITAYIYWEGLKLNKFIIVFIIHLIHNSLVLFSDLLNIK